jgi:ubiquinol-cytochrome c reductase cytochrome c subunit
VRQRALIGAAVISAVATVLAFAPPPAPSQIAAPAPAGEVQHGRDLFVAGCSSCHGFDARGKPGTAPSLQNAGAAAADFYLSTGRMPLSNPKDPPLRQKPAYSKADIRALVTYIGSLGGPGIPRVDAKAGNVSEGMKLFSDHCAGCHGIQGAGGIVTGGVVPSLGDADPKTVGEAVRVGPWLMPRFSTTAITDAELNSIAAYVETTHHPDDRGGWGIGHIGPVPEGMVAWLLAGTTLLLVAAAIGERAR